MKFFRGSRSFARVQERLLPVFSQQVAFVKQASSALYRMACTDDHEEWLRCEKEIKQCEVKGDAVLSEFYEAFYEVFIPLLDREDLQVIAEQIDGFLDQINSAAKSVMLYSPEKIAPQLVDIALYIDKEADAMQGIIVGLENIKKNIPALTLHCDRITELEHAADEVYEEYIGELFRNEKNAVDLMKFKNMAEVFESATDAAKTFSDHIRKLKLRYL